MAETSKDHLCFQATSGWLVCVAYFMGFMAHSPAILLQCVKADERFQLNMISIKRKRLIVCLFQILPLLFSGVALSRWNPWLFTMRFLTPKLSARIRSERDCVPLESLQMTYGSRQAFKDTEDNQKDKRVQRPGWATTWMRGGGRLTTVMSLTW